jgi:DNA-binding response OmpR family regulator
MKIVFVIEPDKVLLDAYADRLGQEYQAITFRSANLAVRALEKVIPDIVVLELALPVHNGLEFLYELKSYADTRNVKVVINSLIAESDIPWGFVKREDLSIVDYCYKPDTTLDQLMGVLRAVD